ncbi:hypothetical protein O1M54_47845 [Streptomyces diastatochromogenes]|nr:hypothetical protein [Streptomyces diastatochromogenes]
MLRPGPRLLRADGGGPRAGPGGAATGAGPGGRQPTTYHLSGTHGLVLLLDLLAGEADRARHEEVTATAVARMRWNRQFVMLADAVLLGREERAHGPPLRSRRRWRWLSRMRWPSISGCG